MTPTQIDKYIENEEKLEQMESDLKTMIAFAKTVFGMLEIGDISQFTLSDLPAMIPTIMLKFQMGEIDPSQLNIPDFKALMTRYEYLVKDQPKNLC